jgi:ribonucleoside-diphosphate reductase alpha chain
MGFAEMLMKLGIPYDSGKARSWATSLMKLFLKRCRQASAALAEQRGAFPNFKGSTLEKLRLGKMRNATLTTIAPTGTLALLANTTSGIEPAFALSFYRRTLDDEDFLEVQRTFQEKLKEAAIETEEILDEVAETGSVQQISQVPKKLRDLFKTAMDIESLDHVRMQAVFQKYTDNAVSKTVNLPQDAGPEDVAKIYMAAYEMKCKGIAVYRYGSHPHQILTTGKGKKKGKSRIVFEEQPEEAYVCGH